MIKDDSPFPLDSPSVAMRLFQEKDFEGAYAKLVQASFSSPEDPRVFVGLALTLEKLGRYEACEKQWSHIRQLAPNHYHDAHRLRHAVSLVEIRAFDDARDILRNLDPSLPDQGEKWELIEKMAAIDAAGQQDPELKQDRLKKIRVTAEPTAPEIVGANDQLVREYQSLIANTGADTNDLNFQSIVIVTYGRTGSTLLQGMLNTIDGVVMLGENENAFFHLFSYLETIKRLASRKSAETPSSPYYGASKLGIESATAQIRATISDYFTPFRSEAGAKTVGLKEVKFKDNPEMHVAYLEFLEAMFPQVLFIFLWRDHDEVLNSGWWKTEDKVYASATLEYLESESFKFSQHRENCYFLDYADLSSDSPKMRELFKLIGASFDPETLTKISQIPHSYAPEKADIRDLFQRSLKQT